MNNLKARLSLAFAIACVVVTAPVYAQGEDAATREIPAEMRFIIEGMQNARSKLQCAEIKATYYQFIPKEHLEGGVGFAGYIPEVVIKDTVTEKQVRLSLNGAQMSMTVEDVALIDELEFQRRERIVADKDRATTLDQWEPIGQHPTDKDTFKGSTSGSIRRREDPNNRGIWRLNDEYDPRSFVSYSGMPALLGIPRFDQQLLRHYRTDENGFQYEYRGEESLYGSRCLKIALTQNGTDTRWYWIDVEHDFLMRRVEVKHHWPKKDGTFAQGRFRVVWEMPKLISSNNVWLPAIVDRWGYGSTEGMPLAITRYTITEFNAHCDGQPADAFVMKWPVGTGIVDDIQDKRFQVFAVEKSDLNEINERRKGEAQEALEPLPITGEELAIINRKRKAEGQAELADAVGYMALIINLGSVKVNQP